MVWRSLWKFTWRQRAIIDLAASTRKPSDIVLTYLLSYKSIKSKVKEQKWTLFVHRSFDQFKALPECQLFARERSLVLWQDFFVLPLLWQKALYSLHHHAPNNGLPSRLVCFLLSLTSQWCCNSHSRWQLHIVSTMHATLNGSVPLSLSFFTSWSVSTVP